MGSEHPSAKTQRMGRRCLREGPARSVFAGGKRELLQNPAYQYFRETAIRDPESAANLMREDPDCVIFAARMMSDSDAAVAIEAGASLSCAVNKNVDIHVAMKAVKNALLYDGNDQVRLMAAKVYLALALKGQDISDAYMALSSAQAKDPYENVGLTAKNALIAAGQLPE